MKNITKIVLMIFVISLLSSVIFAAKTFRVNDRASNVCETDNVKVHTLTDQERTYTKTVCADHPGNVSCSLQTFSITQKVNNFTLVDVCKTMSGMDIVINGKEKHIKFGGKIGGCNTLNDVITCFSGSDWSENRATEFKNVCRSGERCQQWNLTSGKKLYSR